MLRRAVLGEPFIDGNNSTIGIERMTCEMVNFDAHEEVQWTRLTEEQDHHRRELTKSLALLAIETQDHNVQGLMTDVMKDQLHKDRVCYCLTHSFIHSFLSFIHSPISCGYFVCLVQQEDRQKKSRRAEGGPPDTTEPHTPNNKADDRSGTNTTTKKTKPSSGWMSIFGVSESDLAVIMIDISQL